MNKKDKKRLYWLMKNYLDENLNSRFFCNEYYDCYDLEIDLSTLNELESQAFEELSSVVNRFSEFENDLMQYPGVYYDEALLKEKVLKTWNYLIQKQEQLGVMCCFCKKTIYSDDFDPCDIVVSTNGDKEQYKQKSQNFWCHMECFRNALHNNIQQHFFLPLLTDDE